MKKNVGKTIFPVYGLVVAHKSLLWSENAHANDEDSSNKKEAAVR